MTSRSSRPIAPRLSKSMSAKTGPPPCRPRRSLLVAYSRTIKSRTKPRLAACPGTRTQKGRTIHLTAARVGGGRQQMFQAQYLTEVATSIWWHGGRMRRRSVQFRHAARMRQSASSGFSVRKCTPHSYLRAVASARRNLEDAEDATVDSLAVARYQ